jgi:transcriptional regulator with XRE-family HTH domain
MENNSFLPENWRQMIAKNILYERERLNLNQRQLSEHLGKKDPTTISTWENAKGTFNLDVLMSLCVLFDRSPNQMLCEDLSIKPQPPNGKAKKLEPHTSQSDSVLTGQGSESRVVEMDVGGVSSASESPPSVVEKGKVQAMERKLLEMMLELQDLKG